MSGVFAIARSSFDHPFFKPERFTEREAWWWLCGAAAFKPMRVRFGRTMIDLERGQCAFASRFLAVKWKWSEPRVRRFLKRLETDAMVKLEPTRETTRITICNYDEYQFGRRADDAQGDAQTDALATHSRRKEEELNNSNKEIRAGAREDVSRETLVPLERPAGAEKYAFNGVIIKLKQSHFDNWTRAYSALDLRAELTARDAWLSSDRATDADRTNWFISTSKYLANRNQEARNKQTGFKWRSGIEGVV